MPALAPARPARRPPVLGPGGVLLGADAGGRWRVGLTPLGRSWADRFLAACDGEPIKVLVKVYPAVWRATRAYRLDPDDVRQACREGVLRAASRYRPGAGAAFATVATWYVRSSAQDLIPDGRRTARTPPVMARWDDLFEKTIADPTGLAAGDRDRWEAAADVAELLALLPDREREAVGRWYGLAGYPPAGTLCDVGRAMGLHKNRVQQLAARAVDRMRQAAGGAR